MENCSYKELAKKIMEHDEIVLFPHVHMDGDTLGSASALCMALRKLGKRAVVLCYEETPATIDFLEYDCVTRDLPAWFSSEVTSDSEGEAVCPPYDLAMMIDCSSLNRIKWREEEFLQGKVKAVIDHHEFAEADVEFDFGRVEPNSGATGEIVYNLICELVAMAEGESASEFMDIDITNALYSAILTDTGKYTYSNTSARSHEITRSFFSVPGFNPKPIAALIYERNSLEKLKLESMMVASVKLYHDGKLAIGRVSQEMLEATGTKLSDTDCFVQKILGIRGVEVACLMKEVNESKIRVSLRAKSCANVAEMAQRHEGGGHIRAAGCTLDCSLDEAEKILLVDFEETQVD